MHDPFIVIVSTYVNIMLRGTWSTLMTVMVFVVDDDDARVSKSYASLVRLCFSVYDNTRCCDAYRKHEHTQTHTYIYICIQTSWQESTHNTTLYTRHQGHDADDVVEVQCSHMSTHNFILLLQPPDEVVHQFRSFHTRRNRSPRHHGDVLREHCYDHGRDPKDVPNPIYPRNDVIINDLTSYR
jgi:hypothetical protein